MIQRLHLHCPINALGIGQASFNILRELYKRKVQVTLFPYGQPDLSAYRIDSQFGQWIERSVNSRYEKVDRKVPTLNIWHLSDSHFKPSDRQYTISWHEVDSPQSPELNIVAQQDHTFFTSSWTVDNFKTYGAERVSFVPLGLDEDFTVPEHRLVSPDITHWICVQKWEDLRKMSTLKIQAWIKKYGGNRAHQLTLCVNNPFFKPDHMNALYQQAFNGNKPFNVNVLPALKTNAEMCNLYQSADLDISGIARAEGWNIPAHTVTCMGKWSVLTNVTAHKDWGTADNAVLVEPCGMIKAVDNLFFHGTGPFNVGNMYDFTVDAIVDGMERAEKRAKTVNENGVTLGRQSTYAKTVDCLLEIIQ